MTTLLKIKKPNLLDFFHVRQPNSLPDYFEYINIPLQYNLEDSISRWIRHNLKGRFYVGHNCVINRDNKLQEVLQVGFEDAKELSYFTLACPHLKYK